VEPQLITCLLNFLNEIFLLHYGHAWCLSYYRDSVYTAAYFVGFDYVLRAVLAIFLI